MSLVDATGPVFHCQVSVAAAAANVVVAGVASHRQRLLGGVLVPSAATTLSIESSGGTVLVGPLTLVAGVAYVLPPSGLGYQQSASGEGLNVRLTDAVQVGGSLTYQTILA